MLFDVVEIATGAATRLPAAYDSPGWSVVWTSNSTLALAQATGKDPKITVYDAGTGSLTGSVAVPPFVSTFAADPAGGFVVLARPERSGQAMPQLFHVTSTEQRPIGSNVLGVLFAHRPLRVLGVRIEDRSPRDERRSLVSIDPASGQARVLLHSEGREMYLVDISRDESTALVWEGEPSQLLAVPLFGTSPPRAFLAGGRDVVVSAQDWRAEGAYGFGAHGTFLVAPDDDLRSILLEDGSTARTLYAAPAPGTVTAMATDMPSERVSPDDRWAAFVLETKKEDTKGRPIPDLIECRRLWLVNLDGSPQPRAVANLGCERLLME